MNTLKYIVSCLVVICVTQSAVVSVYAEDTSSPSASYDQVYPGLLPDHPLYFLKIARDNVVGFFKGKPIEKADFALLQADKQFSATHVLITQKNNPELAQTTLTYGQQYLEEAIVQTRAAQKEGMNIQEMAEKVQQASKKHLLAVEELKKSLNAQDQDKYKETKKRAEELSLMSASLRQ